MIYSDNFNAYAGGIQDAMQPGTGFALSYAGTLPGWTASGYHAVHAVNLGANDYAPMFFSDNAITLSSGIGANTAGVRYSVSFDTHPTVYTDLSHGRPRRTG